MNIYVHGLDSKDIPASDKLNRLFSDKTKEANNLKDAY